MNRFSLALVIFCFAICYRLRAQGPSDVMNQLSPETLQKTPNVSALEKFGDYPVNLYTGLPDISIPLFEVSCGSLSLPIQLKYHASGIKYSDQSSWVGLGWSLIAGGFISRTVNNKADESSFLKNRNNYQVAETPDCNDYEYKSMSIDIIDREPDEFSFHLPGKSGDFYLRQGGLPPFLVPSEPYRISYSENLDQFDLVDESGIRYRFGKNQFGDRATEYYISGAEVGYVSTWYLMEIAAPDKDDFIAISYQNVGKFYQQSISNSVSLDDECMFLSNNSIPCPIFDKNISPKYSNSSATQLGIAEIRFKTGKVKFVLGENRQDQTGLKKLKRIEVYAKAGNHYKLLKQFEFDLEDYFTSRNKREKLRLKLDGMVVKDGAGSIIYKYGFDYFTNHFSWDKPNNSLRIDQFGFYNNRYNTNLIPPTTVDLTTGNSVTIGTADRTMDTTYLKEGVLRKIWYPTGGYSIFEFEPHRYRVVNKVDFAGGLRVKKITHHTGKQKLVQRYEYGGNGGGTGYKNFRLDQFLYTQTRYFKTGTRTSSLRYRSRMYFSGAVTGRGYKECPVVYPRVIVYDSESSENGKTIYEFDDLLHIPDKVIGYPFSVSSKPYINSMSWARGKLTKKTIFDANNNAISTTETSYDLFRKEEPAIGQGVIRYIYQNGSFGPPYFGFCKENNFYFDPYEYLVTTQKRSTGNYKPSKIVETLHSPDGPDYSTSTFFNYHPEHLQVTTEEKRSGTGSELRVKRHVFDLLGKSKNPSGQALIYHKMLQKNMLDRVIEEYVQVKENGSDQWAIFSGQLKTYKETAKGTDWYQPEKVFLFAAPSPADLKPYKESWFDDPGNLQIDNRYEEKVSVDGYDLHGNVTKLSRAKGPQTAYLYAHEGSLPIARVENTMGLPFAFTSFETKEKGGWEYGKHMTLGLTNAKTGTNAYLLSNGQVEANFPQISENNSYRVSFWAKSSNGAKTWNFMGANEQLSTTWKLIVRSVTSPSVVIKGSGIYIDELRLHPVEAYMTSYTYAPLQGLSSETDYRGGIRYYEYDGFGRLSGTRDQEGFLTSHHEYSYHQP